ncbi:MAG: sulfurtransferase [Gammaproteobacteria bacterium]|nr:sulfurtransferase [Gammaproteobacteria bacterium]MDE2264134.1 sulfurtransferase [Gammaproteobacteria bacterium]
MSQTTLITPRQLAARLEDTDLAIMDCRFDLARPQWGLEAHTAARIPHALYAHLDHDLSGKPTASTGRHPLPPVEDFAARLGQWGIERQVQVVAYDQSSGAHAARLWWLLRWLGHTRVAVLDGGFAAWQEERLPLDVTPLSRSAAHANPARPARRFDPRPDEDMVVSTTVIEEAIASRQIASADLVLIDARSADRFAGRNETIDPVAGHIPGARNHPFTDNLDSAGRFLNRGTLRERFAKTLEGVPPDAAICMCGSGVTACHNLLAMEVAGLQGARLYAGSWSEWIRDPKRPIEPGTA